MVNPQTIKVGKFGTNPVFKYTENTGITNTNDNVANNAAIMPKNASGL